METSLYLRHIQFGFRPWLIFAEIRLNGWCKVHDPRIGDKNVWNLQYFKILLAWKRPESPSVVSSLNSHARQLSPGMNKQIFSQYSIRGEGGASFINFVADFSVVSKIACFIFTGFGYFIFILVFFINSQKNCGLLPTNCLSVFDHFVVLVLKELSHFRRVVISLLRENIKKENSCFSVFSPHITKSKKFRYKKFRTEGWSANINARSIWDNIKYVAPNAWTSKNFDRV